MIKVLGEMHVVEQFYNDLFDYVKVNKSDIKLLVVEGEAIVFYCTSTGRFTESDVKIVEKDASRFVDHTVCIVEGTVDTEDLMKAKTILKTVAFMASSADNVTNKRILTLLNVVNGMNDDYSYVWFGQDSLLTSPLIEVEGDMV